MSDHIVWYRQFDMATSSADGPGIETRHRVYNLRSGRPVKCDSTLVSRVLRSPACDASENIHQKGEDGRGTPTKSKKKINDVQTTSRP